MTVEGGRVTGHDGGGGTSWRQGSPLSHGVLAAIAPDAQVRLLLVTGEVLDRAEPGTVFADHRGRLGRHLLIRHGLEEFPDPQTTSIPRGPLRRQRVIGADHLVAISDIGFLAK